VFSHRVKAAGCAESIAVSRLINEMRGSRGEVEGNSATQLSPVSLRGPPVHQRGLFCTNEDTCSWIDPIRRN
jgi:hypothetical protein